MVGKLLVMVGVMAFGNGIARADSPVVLVPELPEPVKISPAASQNARQAYQAAKDAYERGEVAKSLEHATVAHRLLFNASTANLVAFLLGELKKHCRAFEMALVAVDLHPTPGERKKIADELERSSLRCKPAMGYARFAVDSDPVTVTVGGQTILANRTVGITAGVHEVVMTSPGRATVNLAVRVTEGKETRVHVVLRPATPPPKAEPRFPWALVVGLSSSAAFLGAGVGMYVWAGDALTESRTLSREDSPAAYQKARTAVSTRENLAYVFGGLGVAAAITALVLHYTVDKDCAEGSASLAPLVSPGGTGLGFRASF